ncbi:RNA polymerase sigma factor [Muribaculaceae bacterium Isolate-104 (HZI)]|jgi:RNA polymerase sigma-70 factor (ECF subfamily)|nr:RNA polymerase sigma factor [Muribaculaceae bacterium Isolate-104 (HZI)]
MNTQLFRQKLLDIQGNLLNFAIMLTNNRDDANDLLQDTTLKALDNEEKYADNTNFKAWVFTIMRNIFINRYRRMVRNATIVDTSEDLYQINSSSVTDSQPTPEDTYTANEISKAIASFSDDYRIPFTMHVAGYHYAEIAKHMKLPLGTVKSRIYYARQYLQVRLRDYDPR